MYGSPNAAGLALGRGRARSEIRASIGVVIFTGVLVATLFTLFVIPAAYASLGRFTKTPNWVSKQLAKEAEATPDTEAKAPAPAE